MTALAPQPVPERLTDGLGTESVMKLLASYTEAHSHDPRTKIGAVLFWPGTGELDCWSANRLPLGVERVPELLEPPEPGLISGKKLDRIVHAETGAIAIAARKGFSTIGTWMYCTCAGCGPCCSLIVEAGIRKVVTGPASLMSERWQASIAAGHDTLRRADVAIEFWG